MSEHDEPKTALTRLLGDTAATILAKHAFAWAVGVDHVWCTCLRWSADETGCRANDERAYEQHVAAELAAHLADVLLAEGYAASPAPEATATVEQYGVCVIWEDPLAAGADPKKEPWWAVFDTQEKADRFAQSYQATLGQMAERMPWLAQAKDFDPAEVWMAQNVAEVRRATRWAVERCGPWVPVDRAADEREEGGQ